MSKNNIWSKLDNAAKIFPPNTTAKDTKVFRIACELAEEISPHELQNALDNTMRLFPSFACVMRGGLFWYYLESSDIRPKISEERDPPCSGIYNRNSKNLLFRVTYFGKRINVDYYHALCDGTGALQFIKVLTHYYIIDKYKDNFDSNIPSLELDASNDQKSDDGFRRYYSAKTSRPSDSRTKNQIAYQYRGTRTNNHDVRIIGGILPVDKTLELAHNFGTTLTAFIASVYIFSIIQAMSIRERKFSVVVGLPVNLRQFFYSKTVRNFFTVININYRAGIQNPDLAEIINSVENCMKSQLNAENLQLQFDSFSAIENNTFARILPLSLKNIVLKIAHDLSSKETTTSFSNIGKITMPDEIAKYINYFDFFSNTSKFQLCMCSFSNKLTISFSSKFNETDIQRTFFRFFSELNINAQIFSNITEGDIIEQMF